MEYRFDFDDRLPDLPLAFDLDEVAQVFEKRLLGMMAPLGLAGTVKVKRMQDLKYQPSRRCVATYEMQVDRPGESPWVTIGVLEFDEEGVQPRIYSNDPKMPALAQAVDPEEMIRRFRAALDGTGPELRRLVEAFPVRYKPGLHCVFRYQFETSGEPETYYAKMFADDGEEIVQNIRTMYATSQDHPEMPRVPPPLAYWPDLRMLLQPAVRGGVEFTKYIYDPSQDAGERVEWMRKAGASLAAFHCCNVAGPLRTMQEDLRDLHEYTLAMKKVKPTLAERFEAVIADIAGRTAGWTEPDPVPSHGALRTDQFIIQDDRLAMIDLDGLCWSNPARDIGNFLAYLCWKAIRQPEHGAFVDDAGRAFLDGYLEKCPHLDPRWLAVYQAASLLKIAGRRFRNLNFREWPLVIHLIEAAEASLKQDMSSLEAGESEDWKGTLVAYLSTSASRTKFPATFIDKEFPALWGALNAEMMTDELASILNAMACPGLKPAVRTVRLLAYKPGKRGVIRYELGGTECREQTTVFGKLYPQPYLCDRAYRVMKILWEDVFSGVPDLGVPEPLGSVPELSMLVFIPAEGQFLGEVISKTPLESPETYRIMDLAGAWLANLHQHRIPLEKQFAIEDEFDNIHEWAGLIGSKYPEESDAAEHIARYLFDRALELKFANQVPIHKDFHYEHILVNGGLKVFDFDELRLGDPNIDLAHFCANFYLLAYRNNKHTAHFSNLQNRFFESYTQHTGWQLEEQFLFFYAYTCLKIAKQLCKKRGPRPWPEGEEQRAQVWLMLEQGLAAVAQARAHPVSGSNTAPLVDFSHIRRSGWMKAGRISRSGTSSEAIRVSHKLLS